MLTQEMAEAINRASVALEDAVTSLKNITPETNRALGRIADALEAANNPVEEEPKQITVGLDEAKVSPYTIDGWPTVRYQLPDKTTLAWAMKPPYETPFVWFEVNGERVPFEYDRLAFSRLVAANGNR